jgi:predicted dehydrogenase
MPGQMGVAVLGCGYWGVNYLRVLSELREARVVAVCDQRADRLQEMERRFPGAAYTTQVDAALSHPAVDAVVVCTNATTHYAVTRRALMMGKHVLVEKPLTMASDEADELIELAESKSAVLLVGHTFVYNSGIRKVKEYVQAGRDQVYYLYSSRTNLGPIRSDVNALWDLAPHDVAIFNYLLNDEPQWASAIGTCALRTSRDDIVFATLGYANDVVANIHVSWADPNKVREVVAVGSRRRVVFNDLNDIEPVRFFERGVAAPDAVVDSYGEFKLLVRDGDIVSPKVIPSEPLKNQCLEFVEAIAMGGPILADGRFSRGVTRAMTAIEASIRLKGKAVEV